MNSDCQPTGVTYQDYSFCSKGKFLRPQPAALALENYSKAVIDWPHSIWKLELIVKYTFLVTEICTTVTCSFTVDNYADSATYNGNTLTIITDAEYVENLGYKNIVSEKAVNFESCDDGNPGTLSIKGSDAEVNEGIWMVSFFYWQCSELSI